MKTKNNIYLIAMTVISLFIAVIFITGCGKTGKEVKMLSGEKSGENKKVEKTLKIDTSASTVNWIGKKVTGQHNGTIKIAKGEIGLDKSGAVVNGSFEMDMKSIVNLDLDDAEWNTKLITHLKSEDFFSAEKFPTSKFEITRVEPLNDAAKPNYNNTVSGNLIIKGISKSISFPASIKIENGVLTSFADFEIDRTQWDIKYGSGKFFENLGDKMISDNFNISFKITAK
ncbi:MAG: YceI family protein [Ignavibacteriae bacterium]|nr:YceI family protein [Ignavibacteriota bacterium]